MHDNKTNDCSSHENSSCDEQMWHELFTWILPLIEMWVRYARVPTWVGQHQEIAEDICQEALLRTFRQYNRASNGTIPPIISLKALCRTIAHHCFQDRRRKEWRLTRLPSDHPASAPSLLVDPTEKVLDRLVHYSTLATIAKAIPNFPRGQRLALLIIIANASDLDGHPDVLQQTLSDAGIQLQDYKRPLPTNPLERTRFTALLCVARKRLKTIVQS